jgi:hypothetical protein
VEKRKLQPGDPHQEGRKEKGLCGPDQGQQKNGRKKMKIRKFDPTKEYGWLLQVVSVNDINTKPIIWKKLKKWVPKKYRLMTKIFSDPDYYISPICGGYGMIQVVGFHYDPNNKKEHFWGANGKWTYNVDSGFWNWVKK